MAPKNHSGIGKGKGRGRKKTATTAQAQTATKSPVEKLHSYGGEGKTWEPVDVQINASDPNAIGKLREMAERGEIPSSVIGSRDDRARWFEEFDRLYAEPPGELGKYRTVSNGGRSLDIRFEHNFLTGGVEPRVSLANKVEKASSAEISGATKYAIYQHRPILEQALMYRQSGWPTIEMRQKYGAMGQRVFSDSEKTRIDSEINSYLFSQLKSPLTKKGEQFASGYWDKVPGGWKRQDTTTL